MVYLNKFVAAVKVNGQILRENKNSVLIPFGSEYSILIKNLDSRRAVAKISIDGKSVDSDGSGFILPANGSMEVERYILAGNLDAGNCFKFISRGKEIEEHRGVTADDGIVRVEFTAERIIKEETIIRRHYIDEYERPFPPRPRRWPFDRIRDIQSRAMRATMHPSASAGRSREPQRKMRQTSSTLDSAFISPAEASCGDPGITVAGSRSDQKFQYGEYFPLESTSEVIVLHLLGSIAGKVAKKPVLVTDKPKCSTCGKINKGMAAFCSQCGTALNLI